MKKEEKPEQDADWWLIEQLEGELAPAEKKKAKERLRREPKLAEELAQLEVLKKRIRKSELDLSGLGAQYWDRLQDKIMSSINEPVEQTKKKWRNKFLLHRQTP